MKQTKSKFAFCSKPFLKIVLRTHCLMLNNHLPKQMKLSLGGLKELMNGCECSATVPCSTRSNANHGQPMIKHDSTDWIGKKEKVSIFNNIYIKFS